MIKTLTNLVTGLMAAGAVVATVFYGFSLPIAMMIIEALR